MTSWIILSCTPTDHWHHRMVVEMEETNLAIFLAHHEEDRIQKFGQFGYVIGVTRSGYLRVNIQGESYRIV